MKSPIRRLSASIAALALAGTGAASVAQSAYATENDTGPIILDKVDSRSEALLHDVIIDQLPFGKPGVYERFSPKKHDYEATAYYHTKSITIRTIAKEGITPTINGTPVDQQGRGTVALSNGDNTVTITAGSETYRINVHKVNTDFRGNVMLSATATTSSGTESDNKAVVDNNRDTHWQVATAVQKKTWDEQPTGIELHLSKAQYVARLTAWGLPVSHKGSAWNQLGSSVSIAIQTEDAGEWVEVVSQANVRNDGGIWYWDLGGYHKAKNIRLWLNPTTNVENPKEATIDSIRFDDVEIWGLPEGKTPEALPAEPAKNSTGFNPGTGKWGVDRAQALALQYGILMPAWIPSESYGRSVMNKHEQDLSGGAIPMFYDPPLFNTPAMKALGNSPWSIAKAPGGNNSLTDQAELKDFLSENMQAYRSSLVDIQYGDEGGYDEHQLRLFKKWFEWSKNQYPGAITHSNQNGDGTWINNISTYVSQAKPDLLSWDTYYYMGNDNPHMNPANAVQSHLSTTVWKTYRKAALEGLTGDGTQPIMYGQYLDYNHQSNVSESQKSITTMLSLASGQKWLGLFRMEQNGFDKGGLFDHDGAPTHEFYEFADGFKDAQGMGKKLVALNNTYVATIPGTYNGSKNSAPSGWKMGKFTSSDARKVNAEYGVIDVSATNIGTTNNGEPGDVVVGYFDKLPGLEDAKTKEIFGTNATNPKAIMVVNGLVGQTDKLVQLLEPRTDNGAFWQTAQDVTLTLAKPTDAAKLMLVDSKTGQQTEVTPKINEHNATVTLRLGGGQGALLYWTAPNKADNGEVPAPDDPAAKIGTPFHPSKIWADSEQFTKETRPNGTKEALLDGTDTDPNTETFWHSQWDPQPQPDFPHALVVPTDGKLICGATTTAREGASDGPQKVTYYHGPARETYVKPQPDGQWENFTEVKTVTLNASGQTIVKFDQPVKADAIGLGLFNSIAEGKKYTHMADLRLIECPKETFPADPPKTNSPQTPLPPKTDLVMDTIPSNIPKATTPVTKHLAATGTSLAPLALIALGLIATGALGLAKRRTRAL